MIGRHKQAIMDQEAAKAQVEEILKKRESEYTALKLKTTSLDNKCDRLQAQLDALQKEKGGSAEILEALNK